MRVCLVVALVLQCTLVLVAKPEDRVKRSGSETVWIDIDRNLRVESSTIVSIDSSRSGENWSITKDVLHGGRQEGVDRIRVDNGVLSFDLIPTRGMNIWNARCGELKLGWDSPVKEIVHPQFVNLSGRGGLGWLEGFGGWMCRCGLASNGAPGEDRVKSNTGAVVPVDLTLHGKVNYIPARYVSVEVTKDDPPTLRVRGVVDETMMYGTQLRLTTVVSTVVGSKSLTVRDTIKNLAATNQEFEILYHTNFGAPLLEGGARVVAPVARVTPRNARTAEGNMSDWNRYLPPTLGYNEQVYFLKLLGDAQQNTEILLRNAGGTWGTSLAYSIAQLPHTTIWKNTAPLANGYVTGLEPATNFPNNRQFERENGRVPVLKGGEEYHTQITFTAHTDADAVRAAETRIRKLQGDRQPQLDAQPVPGFSP